MIEITQRGLALLLLKWLHHLSRADWSLSNLAAMVRLNLFTHRSLLEWLHDPLTNPIPLIRRFGDWRVYFAQPQSEEELKQLRQHENTGRLLGDDVFMERLESLLNRPVKKQKPGPKPQIEQSDHPQQGELF